MRVRLPVCLLLSAVIALQFLAGCAGMRPVATSPTAVAFSVEAEPQALAAWRGRVVVASDSGVALLRGGTVERTIPFGARVLALAAGARGPLWIGTADGLFALDAPEGEPRPVALPPPAAVTALAVGADGRVWAGTRERGAFVRGTGGAWTGVLDAAPITALAIAPNGVAWIGSHVGLFRHDAAGVVRYKEEGTGNLSLPDNVVDVLAATAGGAVWVGTPTATAVVEGAEAHPREFSFVGRRGGVLLDAAALPGGGYVLATSVGPLQLPALPAHDEGGMREMFADESVLARPLTDDEMGTPPALRGAPPTRLLAAPDGTVWLASRRGVWPLRRLRAAD